jgi:AraC-like DNA-binding protein
VALDAGYESEAAFNRAFKREFGLPPGQYRKNLREAASDQNVSRSLTSHEGEVNHR